MKIDKKITVELSDDDVKSIIQSHLELCEGICVSNIIFRVDSRNVEGDWSSSMPLVHYFSGALCEGKEK